jgi:hypothetical protein
VKTASEDSPRRYVDTLPSTPQMARYTAAPSAYTDPTVSVSPPNPWGSNFGGCSSCSDLGAEVQMPSGAAAGAAMLAGVLGALYSYRYVKKQTTSGVARFVGALGGYMLCANIAGKVVGAVVPGETIQV